MVAPFPILPDLPQDLLDLIDQIPEGRVTTFGALAQALGDIKAALWVAKFIADHFSRQSSNHPLHRVLRQTGDLPPSFLSFGIEAILLKEGISFKKDRVDLARSVYDEFQTHSPLAELKAYQEDLARDVRLEPAPIDDVVGGVDVSYLDDETGIAAYTLVEVATGKLLWSHFKRLTIPFPYITGYLAFRELPVYRELLSDVREAGKLASVLLVDGNGRLHPRRAGIATHLGVLEGIPTIGVGKKLICGKIQAGGEFREGTAPIIDQEEVIATAIHARRDARPIFVSPGHLTDVDSAARIVQSLFRGEHRLPEPIYLADQLSRREARSPRQPSD